MQLSSGNQSSQRIVRAPQFSECLVKKAWIQFNLVPVSHKNGLTLLAVIDLSAVRLRIAVAPLMVSKAHLAEPGIAWSDGAPYGPAAQRD